MRVLVVVVVVMAMVKPTVQAFSVEDMAVVLELSHLVGTPQLAQAHRTHVSMIVLERKSLRDFVESGKNQILPNNWVEGEEGDSGGDRKGEFLDSKKLGFELGDTEEEDDDDDNWVLFLNLSAQEKTHLVTGIIKVALYSIWVTIKLEDKTSTNKPNENNSKEISLT